MLLLVSVAAAHTSAVPHVHDASPVGLLVLAAWLVAGVAYWRAAA